MSDIRTSRTRLVAAAATVVLAALSLTACNDGTGTKDHGAAANTSSTFHNSTASATTSPSSDAGVGAGANASSSDSDAKPVPAGSRTATHTPAAKTPVVSSGKPVTCEGSNTKTVAAPLTRPVNHMLLTVTNTGSKSCFLHGYPAVSFGKAQAVPPVIDDSQPQAVVTLKPGQSGYASVNLSAADGSGSNGYTAKSLTVYFYGPSLSGSVGAAARPSLPAKGVYVDDSLKVTYWQQSMDDAISW
ncbi:DUF4232 domain-containing protein [Streptomyces sp. NPDC096040]|uniref:DUF4232 domain-containing protein n=1 Tax=Streptomyces sp. NPDC096040 TaxID=3155541 RepID=UPI0033178678